MTEQQAPLCISRPSHWLIAVPIVDLDEAWDAAKDVATETWGLSSGFADLYADSFSLTSTPTPLSPTVRRFHQGHFDLAHHAISIANERDWKRSRFVHRSTDTAVRFASDLMEFDSLDPDLELAIASTLEATDAPRFVDAVHVSGLRRRYKIVRQRNVGPSAKRFVLLGTPLHDEKGPTVVLGFGNSQAEARALAKQLADAGHDVVDLFALSGREGNLPLVRTERELVAQRFTARGTTLALKGEKNRPAGWVFTGPLIDAASVLEPAPLGDEDAPTAGEQDEQYNAVSASED